MRNLLLVWSAFLTFSSLSAFTVNITDTKQLFFFESSLRFNITVNRNGILDFTEIQNATTNYLASYQRERSVFYKFGINQLNPSGSLIKSLNLTIEARNSSDDARRFVNEFELSVLFDQDKTPSLANLTGEQVYVVRPPSFPHFQVKTDWQYKCPKQLFLTLCHVENRTIANQCSQDSSHKLVNVHFMLQNVVFSGGKDVTHNYEGKIEECPLAYETRQDIGIACIATFWAIVAAFILWGVIKYLLKRHRKRMD